MTKITNPGDFVRVELLERSITASEDVEGNPGEYQIKTQTENYKVSLRDLRKELKAIAPNMIEAIILRLENFRIVFINKRTEEVFT